MKGEGAGRFGLQLSEIFGQQDVQAERKEQRFKTILPSAEVVRFWCFLSLVFSPRKYRESDARSAWIEVREDAMLVHLRRAESNLRTAGTQVFDHTARRGN